MASYLALQNGSDIRGIALEGVRDQTVNLTKTAIADIAAAFSFWLAERNHIDSADTLLRVAIGRDSRLSGPAIAETLAKSLAENGVDVADFGLASTPAMFMSTVTPGAMYDAGIMITASHLPFNRNGLKFFTAEGGLESRDIKAILDLAGGGKRRGPSKGSIQDVDFMPVYSSLLRDVICKHIGNGDRPLAGFHFVVDAGNGAGGFYATEVLEPLGADISGSQFLNPDGHFPNHIPNPENEDAMASIQKAVLDNKADLGLIFDTDVDRGAAVDKNGEEINRNRLIAMISAILLEESPGCGIVTDSITSSGLHDFIESMGGKHFRYKRGYKNVINEAKRLNQEGENVLVAIETSGHGALKENYFLDDGAYLVTRILIKMVQLAKKGQDLSSLIVTLSEPAESFEFRMDIQDPDFHSYGQSVINAVGDYAVSNPNWHIAPDNHEGVRVSFDTEDCKGWFLLRLSLHDPLMPLNIESDRVGGSKIIAAVLLPVLQSFKKLDTASLLSFIEKD